MTISSIIALISGVVVAGCAIAGAIAGIKKRQAEERREEEIRRMEHEARMQRLRIQENFKSPFSGMISPVQSQYLNPMNNEIHYYYHGLPSHMYMGTGYQQPIQTQNPYPSAGYAYSEPTWAGERAIGEISKMQIMQNTYNQYPQQYQYNAYPQSNYAYAS